MENDVYIQKPPTQIYLRAILKKKCYAVLENICDPCPFKIQGKYHAIQNHHAKLKMLHHLTWRQHVYKIYHFASTMHLVRAADTRS